MNYHMGIKWESEQDIFLVKISRGSNQATCGKEDKTKQSKNENINNTDLSSQSTKS